MQTRLTPFLRSETLANERPRFRDDAERDRHPWRAAVWIGIVVVAAGLLSSMVIQPLVDGAHGWWLPSSDVWPSILAAHYVANGAFGYVYEASPLFVATPLIAVVLAPVAFLGQALHLTESHDPLPVHQPTMWPLYGAYGLALGVVALYAVRTLIRVVLPRAPVAVLQWATAFLVLVPVSVLYGHYEDTLAIAFVLLAAREVLRGRPERAALFISVAIGFKQWALLGLPLVVSYAPKGRRLRIAALGIALPAVLTGFTLAVDWSHASRALFQARTFPSAGHQALWLSKLHGPTIVGTPFRLGAVAASVAVALWIPDRRSVRVLLAGFALVFLARMFFEPVVYMYYSCPALAFLLLHERLSTGRFRRTLVLGTIFLALFLAPLPKLLWWGAEVALAIPLAGPACLDVLGRPGVQLPRMAEISKPDESGLRQMA